MNSLVEKFTYIGLPKILLEMMKNYFRIEVEGLENLPEKGRALIISNHSGCSGLDAVMLGYLLNKHLNRIPRILALWTFFDWIPFLETAALKMGLKRATFRNGIDLLKKNHLTVMFPEGVEGSFKPTSQRYRLQPFSIGFAKMSLMTKSPIIPSIIIGAEESNINLAKLQFEKFRSKITIPVPLNIFPLPAKWKVRFLPEIDLNSLPEHEVNSKEKLMAIADQIRVKMQIGIDAAIATRHFIYFKNEKNRAAS